MAPPGQELLTEVQAQLLDELAVAVQEVRANRAVAADDAGNDVVATNPDGAEFEAFHLHWRHIKARHDQKQEEQRRSRWAWIEQMQRICTSACEELDGLLLHLGELDTQRQDVVRKTTALHEQCEQMVHDQERLAGTAEAIGERLDMFDRVADVARVLDQGNAATSHPDFGSVLDQLDGSIAFLEAHYDFSQAKAYLHQFEHLRNRACISIRSALQKSLEKSAAQIEQQLRDRAREGIVETQVFYTRFKAAALNYKPLMTMLSRRVDTHETYTVTLEELEGFYVHLRIRLVSQPVAAHLQTILNNDLQTTQLAPATRQASTYIIDISHFEKQCFEAYFEIRQPQEPLRTLLETIADMFYKTLRPVVLSCDSIDSLREMADCLQMDVLEPHQQSSSTGSLVPVLSVVFRLHKDVQEKLIFRSQKYIQEEIRAYKVQGSAADYPYLLFSIGDASAPQAADGAGTLESTHEFQRGWFPTMKNTLGILAKIYRVLEMSTFQGLAQEAVDICIVSLKNVSQTLASRPLPDRANALGPLVQMMDSQLFLIKHLLILREQVAAFECDLVATEKYFNFSNVWDALKFKLPDGLLGILKPKVHYSQTDSKKDIEAELKGACEMLITNLTANMTQPLAALQTQISDFLASKKGDRSNLKDEPFMKIDRLKAAISLFLVHVRERVPFATAHIRLYLTSPGGGQAMGVDQSATVQSTASILFKPVQIRLIDTWTRLETLLQEQELSAAELAELGFMRPDELRELVSSLFDGVMDLSWPNLVEVVSQVARPRVGRDAAPAPAPTPAVVASPSSPVPAESQGFAPPPRVEAAKSAADAVGPAA